MEWYLNDKTCHVMSLQPISFSGISLASWTLAMMTTKYPRVVLHHSVTRTRVPGMCHWSNKSQHGLNNCCKHSPHNYKQPPGPVRNSAVYLPRSVFFHYQCNSKILLQNWRLKAQFSYFPVGLHTNCKGNRYRATVLEHRVELSKPTFLPRQRKAELNVRRIYCKSYVHLVHRVKELQCDSYNEQVIMVVRSNQLVCINASVTI